MNPEREEMKRTVYVDVVSPGKGLVTIGGFGGTIIRDDQRYRVEDESGDLIGYARSYREGGELVAAHYWITPGDVEVDHEWKR